MKIFIVDTYYPAALKHLRTQPDYLDKKPYSTQLKHLHGQFFGTSDSYSHYLQDLGHKTQEVIANDEALQKTWAKEHRINTAGSLLRDRLKSLPYIYRIVGRPRWIQDIIVAQIEYFHPDVVYFQDLTVLDPSYLQHIHKTYKLVGQIASVLPHNAYLRHFDLLLSSLPNLVENINKLGITSKLFRIGFDSRIVDKVGEQTRTYDAVFIGSFSPYHRKGTKMLEQVAKETAIHVWGKGLPFLSPLSPLRRNFHGEAWGIPMYEVLARAKIVVNRHSDVAEEYANNMRMFEATGMGALLLTEDKKNLHELFIPGKEVVTYKDSDVLIGKIRYYLEHDDDRKKIAKAGQKRTLREHTYEMRMIELVRLLRDSL